MSDNNAGEAFVHRLIRVIIVSLLATTGFIQWYLPAVPVVQQMQMPGEPSGGIIVIPRELLHILFDLNGMGYFVFVALVAGWLPLRADRPKRLYAIVAGYIALTIFAWLFLSDPSQRGMLDFIDKLIEFLIVALAVWMRWSV